MPTTDSSPPEEESEARKAGFRALSRERWDKLQAEYAEYRETLLRRIAAAEVPTPNKIKCTQHGSAPTGQPLQPVPEPQSQSFPAGCVLFARHVPPDTNKTALRTRFSALLADAAALDYIDYTKGLDSVGPPLSIPGSLAHCWQCYLRLMTPEYAQELLGASRDTESGLELELLEGRREEVYWENVPEKVRALAVQRAHARGRDTNADDVEEDAFGTSHASGTRGRKRRR